MKHKHKNKEPHRHVVNSDPNITLREHNPSSFELKHMVYKGVNVFIDIHADDHALVTFLGINDFQGMPLEVIKREAPTINRGKLCTVRLIDDYVQKANVLEVTVEFKGQTMGDITNQILAYLQELLKKVANQAETIIPATT